MLRHFYSIAVCASLFVFASCSTTDRGGKSVGKVYPAAKVERVTVVSRTTERVPATRGRIGGQVASVAGSVGGGIAGSILGGIVGPVVENAVIKKKVSSYTLRRDDGSQVTLIQDDNTTALKRGQSAHLVTSGAGTSTVQATYPKP